MTTPSSSTASVMSQATAVDSDATRSIEMGRSPTTGPRDEKQKSAVQKRDPQPDQAQAQAQRRPPAGVANPNRVEKEQDEWEVRWDGENDPGDPLNTPTWKKWVMTTVLALSCVCVTASSSMASDTYPGMEADFHIGQEVATLSVSLFVAGLGVGPLILAPCSEFLGRAGVLHVSFLSFFLFNFPVAFANNIAVHLIFRFFTGFAGSAFLSVSGGTVSDVFSNAKVGTPMMIWSASPFLGPVLGPLLSGFINQHVNWRWTYYVVLIWAFALQVFLFAFVPETLDSQLLKRKAKKLRKETGDNRWRAPVEKLDRTFMRALEHSVKTPFILLTTQPMVLLLDLWSAMILGILYLFFGGVPYIFRVQHGFTVEQTGLAFLGIGAGQLIAALSQPYFNKKYQVAAEKHGGKAPPEERLVAGFYGAFLCPFGIIAMGLLSFKQVPFILPIIFSAFFGWGMVYSYTATFTYLVDAYRPMAASALASNSFLRSSFATGFPLFGQQMYKRLGAVGATCLLGGLMCLCIPLPFVFYRIGARIRANSPVCQ